MCGNESQYNAFLVRYGVVLGQCSMKNCIQRPLAWRTQELAAELTGDRDDSSAHRNARPRRRATQGHPGPDLRLWGPLGRIVMDKL